MKKSDCGFDLRNFLTENKLTQATRGQKKEFGSVMLTEMVMAADPDDNGGYFEEPELDDDPFESEGPQGLDPEEMDECGDVETSLEEAGYLDDEDDDFDIDSPEIPYDARAERAAKKAMGPDTDTGSDDPDAEREDSDGDFEDPEDLGAELGGDGEAADNSLVADIAFGPDVEMEMDMDELNEYLHEFRRPEVAKKVLERAIRTAQRELRESPGVKFLYLILKDGFYKTTKFQNAGRLIAKISQSNPDQGIE